MANRSPSKNCLKVSWPMLLGVILSPNIFVYLNSILFLFCRTCLLLEIHVIVMGTEGGSVFLTAVENLTSVWMNLQAKYVLQVIICATQNLHSPCQTIAHIHMHTHPTTTTHTFTHALTHTHTHTHKHKKTHKQWLKTGNKLPTHNKGLGRTVLLFSLIWVQSCECPLGTRKGAGCFVSKALILVQTAVYLTSYSDWLVSTNHFHHLIDVTYTMSSAMAGGVNRMNSLVLL